MNAVYPPNETIRLEALRRYAVLDTPPEPPFDDLTLLASRVCETPVALISLVDANRQWFKSTLGLTIAETPRDISFCGHAILESDLLVVPDALADDRFATNPLVVGPPGVRFYAGAPLETPDGHRLGTLCVIDYVPRDLSAEQRRALQALSRQVVTQLELRSQLAELARRTTEVAERTQAQNVAEALVRVAQEFGATLDVVQVTDRIVSSAVKSLGGCRAVLFQLDRSSRSLQCVATAGDGDRKEWIGRTLAAGEGVTGRAVDESQPIWSADHFDDPRLTSPRWLREKCREEGVGAVIAVPLRIHGEAVGVLAVLDGSSRVFTAAESGFLASFADLAAGALGNAKAYEERTLRLSAAKALLDIAIATNSTLELRQILRILAQRTAQAIGATRCSINLWRDGHLVPLMSQFADGHVDPTLWGKYKAIGSHPLEDMPLTAEAIRTKRPVIIEDMLTSELLAPHWREVYKSFGTHAALIVPLMRQDKIVGTLSLDQTQGSYAWSQSQIDLAVTIANHAALVADNARLYEDAQCRLGRATALLEMTNILNSTIEMRPLLKDVARRAAQAVGVDRCSVFLCEADGTFRAVMSQFADGHADAELWARLKAVSRRQARGIKVLSEAISRAQPVLIEDAAKSELVPDWWVQTFAIKNMVVVPLIRKGVAVGVLHLSNTVTKRPIGSDQIALAQTIATQVALVIDNARLYDQVRSQLCRLRETQDQLLQTGKLAAIGQLVAGVAHELNNPLAVVMGEAELLKLRSADPLVATRAEKISRSAARATRIVKELQTFARPRPAQLTGVQLTDIVERVVALRQETFRVSGIALAQDIEPGLPPVWGDAQQLEQVVLNLLLNAEQALAGGSNKRRITLGLMLANGCVRLTVSDTGPGIEPKILPRIFEPFFTTKPIGQGTGLGLSISYGIIEAHQGRIWAETGPGQGATFIVELPVHMVDAVRDAPTVAPPYPDRHPGHVLVIEDEEDIAEVLQGMFALLRQEVTVAIGGRRGWEELVVPGARYDLVTVDLKMPDISGPKLWERLVAAGSPFVERVAFVTGDSVDGETERFLKQTGRPVLNKPFDLASLAALIPPRVPMPSHDQSSRASTAGSP